MDPQETLDRAVDFYHKIDTELRSVSESLVRNKDGATDTSDVGAMLTALAAHASVLTRYLVNRGVTDEELSTVSDLAKVIADDVWEGYENASFQKHGAVLVPGPKGSS